MITTPHADWDAKFRLLRQHGMSIPDTVRHKSDQVVFEMHSVLGYNYRMTDIQAAVGREQLKRLPGVVARRRQIADQYRERLANAQWLGLPSEPTWARSNWQSFSVRLPDLADQRRVMQTMLDMGVSTRRGIMCAHREEVYSKMPRHAPLPNSETSQDKRIILPLYVQMTDAEIDTVTSALKKATAI
jgi:dTDP-4-amino-4,6-dideoxygalactose transaminase